MPRVIEAGEGDAQAIQAFAEVIARGGIVAFPTDTVYGIACSPHAHEAVERIYTLKERPREKPLALLLATVEELLAMLPSTAALARSAARKFLPGPLTLVVPKPAWVPRNVVAGRATVGLRVPDDDFCRHVLQKTGPLATTSANFGRQKAYDGLDEPLIPEVDLFFVRGVTKYRQESSVVDFTTPRPTFLREGALVQATFASWLALERFSA